MENTYQPVSRGLLDHLYLMSDASVKLYLYCLLRVRPLGDHRGKFKVSTSDLCYELGWDRRKFYHTVKQMSHYLTVNVSKNQHSPIEIEVQDYKGVDEFSLSKKRTGSSTGSSTGTTTPDRQAIGRRSAGRSRKSLEINGSQGPNNSIRKELNNYTNDFTLFWDVFPRKVKKVEAFKAWQKAIKRAEPSKICASLTRQLPELKSLETKYVPHPATWLNGDRWEDQVAPPKNETDKYADPFGGPAIERPGF